MKEVVEKFNCIVNNIERTVTIFNDDTGKLEYIHPETKIKVVFNFPVTNTDSINDRVIDVLSAQFVSRVIASQRA